MKGWDSDLEEDRGEEGGKKETTNGTPQNEEGSGKGDLTAPHLQKVQKLIYAAKVNNISVHKSTIFKVTYIFLHFKCIAKIFLLTSAKKTWSYQIFHLVFHLAHFQVNTSENIQFQWWFSIL